MRKINRNGEISTNTVITTVIAIIGIVMLGYAVAKIYDNFANQEGKNAENMAKSLQSKINVLSDGDKSSLATFGLNNYWFVAGWGGSDIGRPEKCFLGSCICVCKSAVNLKETTLGSKLRVEICQKEGYCKEIKFNDGPVSFVSTSAQTTVTGVPSTIITEWLFGEDEIEKNVNYIRLEKNLVLVNFTREGDKIILTGQYEQAK